MALLLTCAGAVALPGCAGRKSAAARASAAAHPAVAPSDLEVSPIARSADNGLEVAWWVVTSSNEELSRALAPYLPRPLPMDPGVASLWEANGLRVVAVPLARIDEVQSNLTIAGAIQRQWLGQTPVWTDAITGPSWQGRRTIAMDSGRLALGSGRMRLLARCWTVPVPVAPTEPDPSPAAGLHIELLLQHKEAAGGGSRDALPTDVPSSADPLEAGLIFRRLLAELTVSEGEAYLVLPYQPGEPWGEPEAEQEGAGGSGSAGDAATPTPSAGEARPGESGRADPATPAGREPGGTPAAPGTDPPTPVLPPVPRLGEVMRGDPGVGLRRPPEGAAGEAPVGPPEAPTISIGEALLTSQGVRAPTSFNPDPGTRAVWRAERPARAVLILVPRVPDRFRLIE